MGRTKTPGTLPADMPNILPSAAAAIVEAQNTALNAAEADEVLAAGIDLGRLEALTFITTVGEAACLPIYENVKKTKAWRLLRNPRNSDGRNFESLDEFCRVKLGRSYNRLQELTSNRNAIGQDAFEQAERLGLRQVDYNAIKGLPAPDQELVRRAVEEATSRDEVLDLLQELAARHATEKAVLTKKADDAEAEVAAKEAVLADKNKTLDKLRAQVKRIQAAAPDEALAEVMREATAITHDALGAIRGGVRAALLALNDAADDAKKGVFMAGLVGQLQADLTALREEFNLPDVSTAADAELAAEVAQWAGK